MGILKINAKCSDLCFAEYLNNKGESLAESDSYVPRNLNLNPDNDGDYIDIEINTETGQILNWKPLKEADVINEIKKA